MRIMEKIHAYATTRGDPTRADGRKCDANGNEWTAEDGNTRLLMHDIEPHHKKRPENWQRKPELIKHGHGERF
jgi:sugar lactone lactonase YvrE